MLAVKSAHQPSITQVYTLFISVILIWGLSWPINKMGMQFIPAIWFATFRLVIATLTTFVLVGSIRRLVLPSRRDLPLILSIGIFQMGFFTLLINLGLFYVDAGRSAILTYTTPFWVLPVAVIFFNEKLSPLKILGFILGMIGVIALFSPWSIDWQDPLQLLGNGLLLLAAISFGIALLCARQLQWHRPALELLPWQLLVGTIPVLSIALAFEPNPIIEFNHTAVLTLIYTAVLATAVANCGSTLVSRELPSVTVSIGFLGVPISGLLFSSLILDEPFTTAIKIAMVFIPAGLVCFVLAKK